MADAIAVLNAGSSSLKFSVFIEAAPANASTGPVGGAAAQAPRVADEHAARDRPPSSSPPKFLFGGQAEALNTKPQFTARDSTGKVIETRPFADGMPRGHDAAVELVLAWCDEHLDGHRLEAAGHRVVHGGSDFADPVLVDDRVMDALTAIVPLAPLHQPHNLAAIQAVAKLAPHLAQVACFDTAFHRTQPPLAQAFALPRQYAADGVRRYGFHGLSYEYVAGALAALDARAATGRTVVAHLGNGASMCALRGGRSMATTMGFTAVDGLVMGTRTGSLDPGVILYLMSRYGMDHAALEDLLYHRSGLLGVSGISSDVRTLLASHDPYAAEALNLFVYRIGRELGSLAAALGGLDALVFTGGIGENAAAIRQRVCRGATWLGVQLDDNANVQGGPRISRADSTVSVWIVPTNEELMIAQHTRRVLALGAR